MAFITYKFRIYPTKQQTQQFVRQIGMARWVWNKMIETNKSSYESNKTFVFYNEMAGMLPGLKKDYEWLKESNSQTLQTITKSLETTLKNFIKNPKANGFPKFKNKHNSCQSFVVPQHFTIDNKHFIIPKIGKVKWKKHQKIYGNPKRLIISKDVDQWFVSVMTETTEAPSLTEINIDNIIGIDLGLTDFAVTSDSEIINGPSYNKLLKQERKLQRRLSKKQKGSNNRNKARLKLAKKSRKIRRTRLDFVHQTSYAITKHNEVVVVEDLNIKGMQKNSRLARNIGQQGWAIFKRYLKEKIERKSGYYIEVNRFFPSTKTCSNCQSIQPMPLSQRTYSCNNCGLMIPRDYNAALNIKHEGISIIRSGRPELKLVESHGECAVLDTSRLYETRSS